MQDAFDVVNSEGLRNEYLHVSRQVLILPTVWMHPDLEQVENFASMSEKSDVGSVLERLGMRETIDQNFLDRFSLSFDDKIDGTRLSQNQRFAAFLRRNQAPGDRALQEKLPGPGRLPEGHSS